jgi:hypothetical protein
MIAAMRVIRVYGQVFLAVAVTAGVLLGLLLGTLFALFDIGSYSSGFAGGMLAGLVGGVLMSLVLGTLQLLGFRGAPKGQSLSPRQTREVLVVDSPDLADRIVAALRSLPAEVTAVDVPTGRYAARRGRSWKSWGEDVVVQLSGDPAHPLATVSSTPRVATTLIDYGRGRGNVEHVAGALPSAQETRQ